MYVPLPVLVYQSVPFLPNRKPPLISIVFFSSLVTMEFGFHEKWLMVNMKKIWNHLAGELFSLQAFQDSRFSFFSQKRIWRKTTKPTNQPTNHPANQPASQPASQPATTTSTTTTSSCSFGLVSIFGSTHSSHYHHTTPELWENAWSSMIQHNCWCFWIEAARILVAGTRRRKCCIHSLIQD